jgi:hypothetical protein
MSAPALAQTASQGLAERSTTGNVTTTFTATSTGNNSNQCAAPVQFGNVGPQQNTQGVHQFASTTDGVFGDIGETGGTFPFTPVLTAPCSPKVEQSSAASSGK